jgi:hypothetical protein
VTEALEAAVPVVVGVEGGAATAIGATVAGVGALPPEDINLAFDRKADGKSATSEAKIFGKAAELRKERIANTPHELDSFVQKKINDGVCVKDRIIGGEQIYKFIKKDGNFNKGDLLTKDGLHQEVEWWNSTGNHKGAINPKSGSKYKPADSKKHLNLK